MRANWMRHILVSIVACFALLLAACAQQATKPVPAPVEDRTSQPPAPEPAPAPKPKPKPKPASPPKPEPKVEEPPPASVEGLEPSKVGYYFDTLQGKLRQLANPDVVVDRKDNRITLDVTSRAHFGNDNQTTAAASCAALAPIAKALVEYRMTHIVVDVATQANDSAGRTTAKSRSESIAQCLADAGIASRRIASNAVAGAAGAAVVTLRVEPIVRTP